jgi:hypothetical protein
MYNSVLLPVKRRGLGPEGRRTSNSAASPQRFAVCASFLLQLCADILTHREFRQAGSSILFNITFTTVSPKETY